MTSVDPRASPPVLRSLAARQALPFLVIGGMQLAIDSGVFIGLSWLGVVIPAANVCGRLAGAMFGFILNGRFTFAVDGNSRLGWHRLLRFVLVWSLLTVVSTFLVSAFAHRHWWLAWVAKPLIELALAGVSFVAAKYWIYR